MSEPTRSAADLRDEFDRAFAAAAAPMSEAGDDLLAIAIAGEPYALPLDGIDELCAGRPVTRLAGDVPGLLGVAGLRGALVPVFDLATLLGRDERVPSRWLVTTRGEPRIALSFAQLDGHLRVPRSAIARDPGAARRHVRDVLRADGALRPIVDTASILREISAHADRARAQGATGR